MTHGKQATAVCKVLSMKINGFANSVNATALCYGKNDITRNEQRFKQI
jgi:hypothetical protein